MADYDFQSVLVWDVNPGGTVRTLRNGTVTVKNAATDATLFTVVSDQNGAATFTTTDVPTVYLVSPNGFTSEHITSATAIEAAAAAGVNNDVGTAALVNNASSQTRAALNTNYARKSVYHPRQYGGVGDGVADDTAAVQAAINASIGGTVAAGATTTRAASGVVSLDGGALGLNKWKITAPLQVYSVQGFILRGDGEECFIIVSGALTSALDINGSYFGTFEDFSIKGATTTDTVTTGVAVEWNPTTASRSSTANTFRRILIRNLKYVNGFGFALANPSKQNDNLTIEQCTANGQWTSGELTWWQSGFAHGNGTFGNVLNHHHRGSVSAANRYNFRVNALTGFDIMGGSVGHSEVDFYLQAVGSTIVIDGVRSEVSQRILDTGNTSASTHVALRNITFAPGGQAADGYLVKWNYGGSLVLENLAISQSVTNFKIYMGSSSGRIASVLVSGGSSFTAPEQLIIAPSANSPFVASLRGYSQVNSSGQVIATATDLKYTRTGVLSVSPATTTQTANYTATAADDLIVANGATVTVTLPDPTTVTAGRTYRVKNVNAASATVVSAGTSKTIDGAASVSLAQWQSAQYVSDGTQWQIASDSAQFRITQRGEDAASLRIPTDGVTDASAALAAIPANTGRVVLRGKFRLDSAVTLAQGVFLQGGGWGSSAQPAFGDATQWNDTNFSGTKFVFTNPASAGLVIDSYKPAKLSRIALIGPGSGTAAGLTVGTTNAVKVRLEDVLVGNFVTGASATGMMNSILQGLYVVGCTTGLKLRSASNGNAFLGLDIESCGGALDFADANSNTFTGGVIQGNASAGGTVALLGANAHANIFTGMYWENNGAVWSADLAATADSNQFMGCHITHGAAGIASMRIASNHNAIFGPETTANITLSGASNWLFGNLGTVTDTGTNNIVFNSGGTQFKIGARDFRISSGQRLYLETTGTNNYIGRDNATGDTEIGAATPVVKLAAGAKVFRTGSGATGARPTAASAGAGGMFFDTTLNKPIWSDGTVWKDATGTAV